jgi:hypothetical protein
MSSGLSFRIESTEVDGVTLFAFALYSPSGTIVVFSPYYRDWLELESQAKAFLFNFNHAQVTITDIDGQILPDPDSKHIVDQFYTELYRRSMQKLLPPPQPKKRHLRLVTDEETLG